MLRRRVAGWLHLAMALGWGIGGDALCRVSRSTAFRLHLLMASAWTDDDDLNGIYPIDWDRGRSVYLGSIIIQ